MNTSLDMWNPADDSWGNAKNDYNASRAHGLKSHVSAPPGSNALEQYLPTVPMARSTKALKCSQRQARPLPDSLHRDRAAPSRIRTPTIGDRHRHPYQRGPADAGARRVESASGRRACKREECNCVTRPSSTAASPRRAPTWSPVASSNNGATGKNRRDTQPARTDYAREHYYCRNGPTSNSNAEWQTICGGEIHIWGCVSAENRPPSKRKSNRNVSGKGTASRRAMGLSPQQAQQVQPQGNRRQSKVHNPMHT